MAGTLKLDQAQYRELESFAKFGSDLDPATQAVLEKGKRNVQMLIQPQSSPLRVEEEVAMIYCGVNNLMKDIQPEMVAEFQNIYLKSLRDNYKDVLDRLGAGNLDDDIVQVLRKVAGETVKSINGKV